MVAISIPSGKFGSVFTPETYRLLPQLAPGISQSLHHQIKYTSVHCCQLAEPDAVRVTLGKISDPCVDWSWPLTA